MYAIRSYYGQAKGLPIVNLLPIEKDEIVKVMLTIKADEKEGNIVFCTQSGLVKRTDLIEFESIRTNGKIAITLT